MLFASIVNFGLLCISVFFIGADWVDHVPALFLAQFISFSYALRKHLVWGKDLFLPSVVFLSYVCLNFTLGAYLVGKGYGISTLLGDDVRKVVNFRFITVFYIVSNYLVFLVTFLQIRWLNNITAKKGWYFAAAKILTDSPYKLNLCQVSLVLLFFVVSVLDIPFKLSVQILIVIVAFFLNLNKLRIYRWFFYSLYLALFVSFNFHNKREIAIALFCALYFEFRAVQYRINLSFRSILSFVLVVIGFLALVMTASISRGYGSFEFDGVFGAVLLIPKYVSSDFFMDALVENLELSYVFPAAYLAMDHVLEGKIDYQYGLSYLKIFFLPLDRDFFSWKPDSFMTIFTRVYDPGFYSIGGSYPILAPSEAFANFGVFSLLFLPFLFFFANKLAVGVEIGIFSRLKLFSMFFLIFTFFIFVRGSGVELYLLYWLVMLPWSLLFNLLFVIFMAPGSNREK